MTTVLYVDVREDFDVMRMYCGPVPEGCGGRSFDEPFVCDVGIGPLIGTDEPRTGRLGDGNALVGCISETEYADRDTNRFDDGCGYDG